MRISEILTSMASWLEDPSNEAILLSEYNEECMQVVANSLIEAAEALKKAAQTVEVMEPQEESKVTPEAIEGLGELAAAFDASGDLDLMKQASVIDELLLTIAAPPNALADKRAAQDKHLDELNKKYKQPREDLEKSNKIADSLKAIEKSKVTEGPDPKVLGGLLSTRCPDHAGSQISRVGEHMWQCPLDKKIYNYETGFTLENNDRVPGGDVTLQTPNETGIGGHQIFDTRQSRLGTNIP